MGNSLHKRLQTGVEQLDIDFRASDGRAGFGEANLGFHQLVLESVEFIGGGRGASDARRADHRGFLGSVVHDGMSLDCESGGSGVLAGVRH